MQCDYLRGLRDGLNLVVWYRDELEMRGQQIQLNELLSMFYRKIEEAEKLGDSVLE